MTNIAASVTALTQIKDVTPDMAQRIRKAWKTTKESELFALSPNTESWVNTCYNRPKFRAMKRHAIDCILGTHGVEFLGIHKRNGADVYYCNSGDAYDTTIVFIAERMYVTCWAYYVESNLIREVQ